MDDLYPVLTWKSWKWT